MIKKMFFPIVMALCVASVHAATPSDQRNEQEPVHYMATFSNMEFTEEHAYGSQLELWKHGSEFMGLFMYSEGLAGDTPTGLLENVWYDPRAKSLTFDAKLTTGVRYRGPGKEEPTRDLFVFSGELREDSVVGELKRIDKLEPNAQPVIEKVILKKEKSDVSPTETFRITTLKDWTSYSEIILKHRGPKW
jgi:hypothetical protein